MSSWNEITHYAGFDWAKDHHDVVIVDLDSNPEFALEIVETLCAGSPATVMVYSGSSDTELMIRCMRAGAREFLTLPITQNAMAEAMVRASVRRPTARPSKKANGRMCVFWGAKGGSGVTTIATNFAISAARETDQSVLLIDLDLPLGPCFERQLIVTDVALGLQFPEGRPVRRNVLE